MAAERGERSIEDSPRRRRPRFRIFGEGFGTCCGMIILQLLGALIGLALWSFAIVCGMAFLYLTYLYPMPILFVFLVALYLDPTPINEVCELIKEPWNIYK